MEWLFADRPLASLLPVPGAYALGYILSSYGLGPAKIVAGCQEFEGV
jgi:hypothetical protein